MPEGREDAAGLRVWVRQHRALGCPGRAPGSRRRKVGSAYLLYGTGFRPVDAFHAAALASGGNDNGAPGLRPIYAPDYYAAFIIDPDRYRIEAYYGPSET